MANRDFVSNGSVTKESLMCGISKRCAAAMGEDFVPFSNLSHLNMGDLWQIALGLGFKPRETPWLVAGQLASRRRMLARMHEQRAGADTLLRVTCGGSA